MKKVTLFFTTMLIAFVTFSQDVALLDSTIVYDHTSGSAVKQSKDVYDEYNSVNDIYKKSKYSWDGNWNKYGEEYFLYNANGDVVISEYYKTIPDTASKYAKDKKTTILYDKAGYVSQEITSKNKYDGLGITPNWEESKKDSYYRNDQGKVDSIETYAELKYWQGITKTFYEYNNNGNVKKETQKTWIPRVKVKEYAEAYYSQNEAGDANYLFTIYEVDPSATDADLEAVTISKLATVLNVFVNENGENKRYDLVDVAGKTLKAVLDGDNRNSVVIDKANLRTDYLEWFKTVEDDKNTLLNCNIKEGRPFEVKEVVVVNDDLKREVGDVILNVTAYRVKGAASLDQLTEYVAEDNAGWANIYIEDGEDVTTKHILNIGGKSLKEIMDKADVAVEQLAQGHIEKYTDKTGDTKRVKVNIEIITPQYNDVKIDIYTKLYDTINEHFQAITAYNIHDDAQTSDLDKITTGSNITSLLIYKADGSVVELTSDIADKTLSQILVANSIEISDLSSNNKQWLWNENGRKVRVPVNIKEATEMGAVDDVVVTPNLFSTGSNEYLNTAYDINTTAELDLLNYTLNSSVEFLDVYIIDENGNNVRVDLHGVGGKTLYQALSKNGNDEAIDIDITKLNHNYGEWFKKSDGTLIYVQMNAKAVEVVTRQPVVVTENLMNTSFGLIYDNTTYLAKGYATEADLDAVTLSSGIEYLNVYAYDNDGNKVRYGLHGVDNKTLKEVLIDGDNTEGVSFTVADLNQNYVEWFVDKETGEAELIKLNVKAVKISNDLSRKTYETTYTYSSGKKLLEKLTLWYDDSESVEYAEKYSYTTNQNGQDSIIMLETGNDGTSFIKDSKRVFTYNILEDTKDISVYKFNGSDFDLQTVETYYYIAFKALAGKDQYVVDSDMNDTAIVILDGRSSYDISGGINKYEWIVQDTVLATGDSVAVKLPTGVHSIILKVTDNNDNVDTDTVVIVVNDIPLAYAGKDMVINDTLGKGVAIVKLSGSDSKDNVGGIESYIWTDIQTGFSYDGEFAQVSVTTGVTEYILQVTDVYGEQSIDNIIIILNGMPVADAGEPQTVKDGTEVTLDGSGSSDPEKGILTYEWIEGTKTLATTVTADVTLPVGEHTIVLQVTDDKGASATDTVVITVEIKDGVAEQNSFGIKMYPNPVIDGVYINGNISKPVNVIVYNTAGIIVAEKEINKNGNGYINMQNIESGTYIVRIVDNKQVIYTNTIIVK